jgi:DNA repair exonuclease SbcCD ATPase subunit
MSETSGEETVTVDLPSDLHDWLEEQARTLETDKDQLLMELLVSYQTTIDNAAGVETQIESQVDDRVETVLDEQLGPKLVDEELLETIASRVRAELEADIDEQIEGTVKSILAETLDEQIQSTVEERVRPLVTDQISEATTSTQRQLDNRIDTVEDEFQGKLEDVRNRVIQVKKEADKKAATDHTHDEFETLATLERRLESLESELQDFRVEIDDTLPEHGAAIDQLDARLEETEDRLQTVAWITSDLRDAVESGSGLEAVERIKRAAAKANISSAKCENCSNEVNLALLTDPECPHCNATVNNVDANPGWFRSPRLEVASQLESGDGDE